MARVALDRHGKVAWIRGHTDMSPLSYSAIREMEGQNSGIVTNSNGESFEAPFTIKTLGLSKCILCGTRNLTRDMRLHCGSRVCDSCWSSR